MFVIWMLLAALVTALCSILFMPVLIVINSRQDCYMIRQAGTFTLVIRIHQVPHLTVQLLGFHVDPMGGRGTERRKADAMRPRHPRLFRKSASAWAYLVRDVTRSFRVRRLHASADLGDAVLNAQLFPFIYWVGQRGSVNISVNFRQINYIDLVMEARVQRICWAFVRFITKK